MIVIRIGIDSMEKLKMARTSMTKSIYDQFVDWLYETQSPIWDDRLVDLMEDSDMFSRFLEDNDLPPDTELK